MSRPARGAWVEIADSDGAVVYTSGRAPQGARGLKLIMRLPLSGLLLVAPRKGRVG